MTRIKFSLVTASRPLWVAAGAVSVAIGALGAVLPVLPTTPFIILGTFCFARGSPRLARTLEQHRVFGPMIADWRIHRAIAPRYKLTAHVMMGTALIASCLAGASGKVLTMQTICLACASAYILSRPNGGDTLNQPDPDSVPAKNMRLAGASNPGDSS
ncbi:MAG: YbaN family protein [Pseudomonadota bacterium]